MIARMTGDNLPTETKLKKKNLPTCRGRPELDLTDRIVGSRMMCAAVAAATHLALHAGIGP